MKNNEHHSVGTMTHANIELVESVKIDNPNTEIHDRSLSFPR